MTEVTVSSPAWYRFPRPALSLHKTCFKKKKNIVCRRHIHCINMILWQKKHIFFPLYIDCMNYFYFFFHFKISYSHLYIIYYINNESQ